MWKFGASNVFQLLLLCKKSLQNIAHNPRFIRSAKISFPPRDSGLLEFRQDISWASHVCSTVFGSQLGGWRAGNWDLGMLTHSEVWGWMGASA